MKPIAATKRVSDPTEIRFGERFKVDLPVKLDAGEGLAGDGMMCDISISGAFIETSLELPVFTNLEVSLPARESLPARKLAACVVRQSPYGVAIEWRDMACATLMAVLRKARQDAGIQPTA
jgi:hypothetical protein